ncbi:hypothetical protein NW801_13245 [Brevibacillus laterosporus]|uniref:Nucleotidyltransferase n=1 Tax=Brevibacillus halotolerans TaxID=1507437 RepID=A0ABT4HY52_9BACL|nr:MULTISPECIES: hypothetical protein [Brevibacillus]MCR8985987.1 hypothetical protein [Brevibacillus laterosporus]MCZ0831720.1 hypothetical protein [Brevibacillus halotolerans]
MKTTVDAAWNTFLKEKVNLDPVKVTSARSSRNWLVEQIEAFPKSVPDFPSIYSKENDVQFGSFSRRTKIRELDDIDFLIVLSAHCSTYNEEPDRITINVPDSASILRKYCDDGLLNSRKLLNKLRDSLKNIPQYDRADIHSRQEAITLKLKSYSWNFDVVPSFLTTADSLERTYYLIPDGSGNWKKTDPRIDSIRTTSINQHHDGKLLNVIRLIKYWNNRPTQPKIGSYLLENMILNFFENVNEITSQKLAVKDFFNNLSSRIYLSCPDPKGIQGDLNNISFEERIKISEAADTASKNAANAISYGLRSEHKKAITEWKKIFGPAFPDYTE